MHRRLSQVSAAFALVSWAAVTVVAAAHPAPAAPTVTDEEAQAAASRAATRIGEALAAAVQPAAPNATVTTLEDEELREIVTREAMKLGEVIDEEVQATSAAGNLCAANCAAGYTALCLYIGSVCPAASVVTIGGATIPCATATAIACIGSAAVGAICARQCPP